MAFLLLHNYTDFIYSQARCVEPPGGWDPFGR